MAKYYWEVEKNWLSDDHLFVEISTGEILEVVYGPNKAGPKTRPRVAGGSEFISVEHAKVWVEGQYEQS